ncbi:hypothetical protein H257_09837 [Aphanomyces astaci]|uniref:Ubiquitin-like domain-containing protein n=1 Tax=Aphanomyces astaci TaxID=112090 RepID=W4G824_APHAT|nr:hypothetical protein H257_09837 [Aphanomyces astaci]ETV75862.1 hypothetical protein H257_09837 [Aphanomyces astaci]|eukprot:XP_009834504.1 hypothetical protein H257_09837 [Aphanomyces astaci]
MNETHSKHLGLVSTKGPQSTRRHVDKAETVQDLKDKFPAHAMQLYWVNGLMQDKDERLVFNATTIETRCLLCG